MFRTKFIAAVLVALVFRSDVAPAQAVHRSCDCRANQCMPLNQAATVDGLLVNRGGVFFVALDRSACFTAVKDDPEAVVDSDSIARMHVAPLNAPLKNDRYDVSAYSKAVGARVRLTGTPEYATTAHHHSQVVFFTKKIDILP